MSIFAFLSAEFPEIGQDADHAAMTALADPRTSCFYARRVVEVSVRWAFKHDRSLRHPYEDNLSALLNAPAFRELAGDTIYKLAREVSRLGNKAVHDSAQPSRYDSVAAVSALFEFAYWFARIYSRTSKPPSGLVFDPKALPDPRDDVETSVDELDQLRDELMQVDSEAEVVRERTLGRQKIEEELALLRREVAEAKRQARTIPDDHDYSEAETRDFFIDLLLAEAGWQLDSPEDREYEVTGMPNDTGIGYVDYVLWGGDGNPLAVIEAKRTRKDPAIGQQQAVLYANCLEQQFGQRPVIFYTNGYKHWVWDDTRYPPRPIQGFYKKDELELVIQRRSVRGSLLKSPINERIVDRHYQHRAIRQISEAFEVDNDRKSLLVMATGSGKTRTVVALTDLLMQNNWAKRVLFLADRNPLVKQAVNAFKQHLPDSTPVNLVTEKNSDGRVFVSTYQTMMGLIEKYEGDVRRFGVGHFDLVVIDEAHRSVFKKYRAIFEYFDSLLVGLTATPRDEVDRNTYSLFDLETGVPTDVYELEEAVADGFLVPPRAISAPMKFPVMGIVYDELSEEEKAEWDELDWTEGDESIPDRVDPGALNSWLFNKDTVDRALELLMTKGQRVAGGDRLGKTIVFAKNQAHASFIAERFDVNYPNYAGRFARAITHQVEYAQDLIDKFSITDSEPHIAISVDMLDTGIDIPEVVNLVFFKPVRSKTKFWQMLGRGTRRRPDLFGPGEDKEYFTVFDHCLNLEYFSQEMVGGDGPATPSLSERLFRTRLEVVELLDRGGLAADLRIDLTETLRQQIESMNVNNFVVRPHRDTVERYREARAWVTVNPEQRATLARDIAGLPDQLPSESEESKRFDLLILHLQLKQLQSERSFVPLRDRVIRMVEQLQTKDNIPAVAAQMPLIDDMLTEAWWRDVTVEMLEDARRRLRGLVQLLEIENQKPLFTDFEDRLIAVSEVDVGELGEAASFAQFRKKAKAYLGEHLEDGAVGKIYTNQPLTDDDIEELRSVFVAAGVGSPADIETAASKSGSFPAFVRSLTGLDRVAAKQAFGDFLNEDHYRPNQIRFVNLIIDYLTDHGTIQDANVYGSPFVEISPSGPEDLFTESDADELFELLAGFRYSPTIETSVQ